MMHIIDFSDGIRSEEIQENFELLDAQIKRTSLSIAGSGIASGLDITPIVSDTEFAIQVSAASIVTNDGNEIFIESQKLEIERPKLSKHKEYIVADINNQVKVSEVPYMLDRICPVQYGDSLASLYSGITVSYQNSSMIDDYIRVRAVNGKVLTLTGLTRRNVVVEYYSTAKRIDTVYIDADNKLSVKTSSITSTTPSAILPEHYKYLVAFVLIDSRYMASAEDTPHADIIVKKDLRQKRNIYTDQNGMLYLNGMPFNDLNLITTIEPVDPRPNQLWLDNGTLYVWLAIDEYTYKRSREITSAYDFTGYHDIETNIEYMINGHQLKVYLNSEKLQESQYDEIFGGIPSSLQEIPANTYSNVFRLYDALKVGDTITYTITFNESGYRWVPVNKESYVRTKEHKAYDADYWSTLRANQLGAPDTDEKNAGYPYKFQYFIFHADEDKRLFFTPFNYEVDVMVNQLPLHKDQYSEITLEMLYDLPQSVQDAIRNEFGWDDSTIYRINELYDNIGIGIMLHDPLDCVNKEGQFISGAYVDETELYVEIIVNRACSSYNNKRKLQRNATYIYDNAFTVEKTSDATVNLDGISYRYNENQLEVFINGIRLRKDKDFKEGTDLDTDLYDESDMLRTRGAESKQFRILRNLNAGDEVSYKITSSFYSYDHINSLIDQLETDQEACNAKVESLYNSTMELHDNTNAVIQDMQEQIAIYTGNNNNAINTYLTRESIIDEDQFAPDFLKRVPQSIDHICMVVKFEQYSQELGLDVTEYLRPEDFILIWWRDSANNNIDRMLIPEIDYEIQPTLNNVNSTIVTLRLDDSFYPNMKTGDKLIIRGIKFGRAGR